MRYLALAADYDGTLAVGGVVAAPVVHALESLKRSGRKLLLVTGRQVDEIVEMFPAVRLFEQVVAENGAVLYGPQDGSEKYLAERPPEQFIDELRRRNISPLSVGRVIIAASAAAAPEIFRAIRESGLELELIFNKSSVMVLPRGVDKASGLRVALQELQIALDALVAVGDGENDIPMLEMAGCGAAVAGALDPVKQAADIVLSGDAGEGVIELIDRMAETQPTPPESNQFSKNGERGRA